MKDKMFDELVQSVQQAMAIRRGEMKVGRTINAPKSSGKPCAHSTVHRLAPQ